jgi:hypothetical protein
MQGAIVAVLTCVALLWAVPLAARQPSLEYDVKAAFVLNFVRFVEWPQARRTPPLRICVLQSNPFGDRLDAIVTDEQWQGGEIDVRVIPELRRGTDCHLLYVPESAAQRFEREVSAVSGLPILMVGEHPRFLEQGGMIRLFLEGNRVRFSINQKSADSVGLLISSRLLRLARTVVGSGGPP